MDFAKEMHNIVYEKSYNIVTHIYMLHIFIEKLEYYTQVVHKYVDKVYKLSKNVMKFNKFIQIKLKCIRIY
jgi:hypothetical protein